MDKTSQKREALNHINIYVKDWLSERNAKDPYETAYAVKCAIEDLKISLTLAINRAEIAEERAFFAERVIKAARRDQYKTDFMYVLHQALDEYDALIARQTK